MKKNVSSSIAAAILAIVCVASACNMGKSRAKGTGDIKDPNTLCALLNDLNFDTSEYREDRKSCAGKNPDKVFYEVIDDQALIRQISIAVLPEAKAEDAAKNAETVAQAVNIIWQKLLEQPAPDNIKRAILEGEGEKRFSDSLNITVSRYSPKVSVTIDIPSTEKLAALKKMQTKPIQGDTAPRVVTTGLKAPEPCGYLEKSMSIAAAEYKKISGDDYGCDQEKKLVAGGTFRYQAFGNQSLVNALDLTIYIPAQATDDQKQEMKKLLALAANEVAAAAGASKLSDDAIAASVAGETKDFTPTTGTDESKPPIKQIMVVGDPTGDANSLMVRHIIFKF